MKGRYSRAVIVLVAIGAVGGLGALFAVDTRDEPVPSVDLASSRVTTDELARAASVRVFFAHMSVGRNILSGVETLAAAKGVRGPRLVEFSLSGPLPAGTGAAILHTGIGENGDPFGKLDNFDSLLRSGLAGRVDVAVLKFCYADITRDTDVELLFERYRATLEALQRDYPAVTFVHTTAPLTVGPATVKDRLLALLGRDDNTVRQRYNALIRATYPAERVFDIAAVEATAPDGTTGTALYRGYTTDGGHLNEPAAALVAAAFVRVLADGGLR